MSKDIFQELQNLKSSESFQSAIWTKHNQQFWQNPSMAVRCREAITINFMWSMNGNFCKFSGFRTSLTYPFLLAWFFFSPQEIFCGMWLWAVKWRTWISSCHERCNATYLHSSWKGKGLILSWMVARTSQFSFWAEILRLVSGPERPVAVIPELVSVSD